MNEKELLRKDILLFQSMIAGLCQHQTPDPDKLAMLVNQLNNRHEMLTALLGNEHAPPPPGEFDTEQAD